MIPNARDEILRLLDALTPAYVGADHLREIEEMLESVEDECGQHPLTRAAIEKISARIAALEIGEMKGEKQ